MLRIALTALGIYLLWTLIRWVFRGSRTATRPARNSNAIEAAEMVACAKCGTFVVSSDMICWGNNKFCSQECADKH